MAGRAESLPEIRQRAFGCGARVVAPGTDDGRALDPHLAQRPDPRAVVGTGARSGLVVDVAQFEGNGSPGPRCIHCCGGSGPRGPRRRWPAYPAREHVGDGQESVVGAPALDAPICDSYSAGVPQAHGSRSWPQSSNCFSILCRRDCSSRSACCWRRRSATSSGVIIFNWRDRSPDWRRLSAISSGVFLIDDVSSRRLNSRLSVVRIECEWVGEHDGGHGPTIGDVGSHRKVWREVPVLPGRRVQSPHATTWTTGSSRVFVTEVQDTPRLIPDRINIKQHRVPDSALSQNPDAAPGLVAESTGSAPSFAREVAS